MQFTPRIRFIQLLVAVVACGGITATAQAPWTVADFQAARLLKKFDRDGDGRLDPAEKASLREAFGGIDVPMLPDMPVDYASISPPPHLDAAELAKLDSTPTDNRITNAGAMLGQVLFYDRQLSRNDSVACASCHEQRRGFADPRRFSEGFAGGLTGRNSMSLANLRFSNLRGAKPGSFWDERAATLEIQALLPIQDAIEMGLTLDELELKLQKLPYYPAMFSAAFGSEQVTRDRVAKSLAQFVRSLQSWDSKYDRVAAAKANRRSQNSLVSPELREEGQGVRGLTNNANFSAEESLGQSLFFDGINGVAEFGCAHCHMPPTFGMPQAFNNGLDLKYADAGLGALKRPANDPFTPSNDGKFKAPSLRNVALTGPYMHDGRFKTLEQVVEHYSRGVQPHENLGLAFENQAANEPLGFKFSDKQKTALVAFLKTLTDERFVTDPRFSDPFVRPNEK